MPSTGSEVLHVMAKSVLIVDDSQIVRREMRYFFETLPLGSRRRGGGRCRSDPKSDGGKARFDSVGFFHAKHEWYRSRVRGQENVAGRSYRRLYHVRRPTGFETKVRGRRGPGYSQVRRSNWLVESCSAVDGDRWDD